MMRIGVLGGGQLGRMLALAGLPLGLRFRFLDPAPDCPAADLGGHVCATFDDLAALERFGAGVDVVTYEFENVPVDCARRLAETHVVRPTPRALEVSQDRLDEKHFLRSHGVATADFLPVGSRSALQAAAEDLGLPAVLKTRRHGYDGRGQVVLHEGADVDAAWSALHAAPSILESFVPFRRELSLVVARAGDGRIAAYPLVENVHRNGILHLTKAPAGALRDGQQRRAEEQARVLLEALDYVGVLSIEWFELEDGSLVANEIAPRVHNSGHWTIEGARTSQFANHVRAIAGLPLGSTDRLGFAGMVNVIGNLPEVSDLLSLSGAHVHLYGKEPRAGRKLGHVNVRADSEGERDALMERVAAVLGHG